MTSHAEAAAAVRRARQARDAARGELYRRQLAGLALEGALRRQARGDGARDPAADPALRILRDKLQWTQERRQELARDVEALPRLEEELARLGRHIESASADAAATDKEISRLGARLAEAASAEERRRLQAGVQTAQARRAALADAAAKDGDAATAARTRMKHAQESKKEEAALVQQADDLREAIGRVERQAGETDLGKAAKESRGATDAARRDAHQLDADLRKAIDALYAGRLPPEVVAAWDDSLPITLLPLRLETRWRSDTGPEGGAELWVRVYPDDLSITSHEPALTPAEVKHGEAYWVALRAAAGDANDESAAWKTLAGRFGGNRAAWVARQTRPLNWEAAVAAANLALEFPAHSTKPDGWTTAPHSRVLPDRLVLMAWRGETLQHQLVGKPVDDIVVLGPSPIDAQVGDASVSRAPDLSLQFGPAFEWVRDFDRAEASGLAFRLAVTPDDVQSGFDRLLVLGLKLSADAAEAQEMVEALINDHHYSKGGFELLGQGTPTNNTEGNDSGYSRAVETAVAGTSAARFTPADDRASATDGQRFADLLGISYEPLLHVAGADRRDHVEAVAMNRALYSGTLGYYLDQMLDEALDENALARVRRHFTDQVTGRGPVAAMRVGNQPYGVLPTSSLGRWQPGRTQRDGELLDAAGIPDPFETGLLAALRAFDQAWSSRLADVPQLGAPGDASANLLQVLGLHPTSAEFHQRVGYSYDYLRNLESFAWGGTDFADVIRAAMEGAGVRAFLRGLGYQAQRPDGTAKPLPLLLQLIWRHHQTQLDPRQLIDGQPLSEKRTVKPYGATGATYLDWLLANASNAGALEAQDFGGAARPSSLLYMMLQFALVMEGGRAIRSWLADRNVSGEELVRSRKFLNMGGATPSLWEVFRAPANRIVASEKTSRPLFEVVHAPQHSGDAGRWLEQQKAALATLRSLPTARLERALVEHIDSLSYRLDAWVTSLFASRLGRQRRIEAPVASRRTGLYLGAYGYLERVQPDSKRRVRIAEDVLPEPLRQQEDNLYRDGGNGGYVHAPSLNHATAAALLRNGYLTHATPGDPQALSVNLSSGRVQRARQLLEGIRNGQSLEVLLGVQFERGLHDWTTRQPGPVVLDQLKPLLRSRFPIVRTRVPQANDTQGATEVHEDHQVVNGLVLARTTAPYPYGIPELGTLDAAQKGAIQAEKTAIEDSLDALRDVLTAESAYQLALGNFDRAAAVLQSAGSGTAPPDVQVLDTPRGTGISFTQRLAVQFDSTVVASPWGAAAMSERARLEPALNAWLGDLLGEPEKICCRVAAVDADGHVLEDGGVPIAATLSVADLDVQPIDFLYLMRAQAEPHGAAELETRLRHCFAQPRGLADDAIVRITFAEAGADPEARPFAEVLPLADRLRRILGTARPLDARHFRSASKDAPGTLDNPGSIDAAELRARVGARIAAVRALFPPLQAAADTARATAVAAEVEALRDALLAVARSGVSYAMPRSTTGTTSVERDALVQQADALLKRAEALGATTDQQIADAAAATSAETVISLLATVVKTWLGGDMVLLPRFRFGEAAAVAQADGDRDALLDHARTVAEVSLPVEEWLHGAACVRKLVHDFEMARAMADATRDDPLPLSPIQLPYRSGDSWLGARYPETMEVLHDTVSVVQHLPQGFDPAAAQCGLMIDEWTEVVPTREEVTGLCFNFNAPNSSPPQVVLLAITPRETGSWAWDDLVDSVLDTFRRAKLRAVEPDSIGHLTGIGTLLPAVMAEFGTSLASVSLDYSLVVEAIRDRVMAMRATHRAGG